MSRAFVKETAESAAPPERMVDEGSNLVTPEGLAQIEAHITRIEAGMKTENNVLLRETLARDLRYWEIRKASAEVVQPACDGTVAFGCTVTIQRKDREQTFRIVGVDEADASKGLISFRSPLVQAILGARPGDIIEARSLWGRLKSWGFPSFDAHNFGQVGRIIICHRYCRFRFGCRFQKELRQNYRAG
jgi:transcription elongation GreA/GreB family factor